MAERLLCKAGIPKAAITLLSTGEEGIAHLRTLLRTGQPAIVLLDINLGTMTGFDVLAALPGPAPFPVYACTSYVSAEDQGKYVSAGFAGLLGKPYSLTQLTAALLCARAALPTADPSAPEGASKFSVHI